MDWKRMENLVAGLQTVLEQQKVNDKADVLELTEYILDLHTRLKAIEERDKARAEKAKQVLNDLERDLK